MQRMEEMLDSHSFQSVKAHLAIATDNASVDTNLLSQSRQIV